MRNHCVDPHEPSATLSARIQERFSNTRRNQLWCSSASFTHTDRSAQFGIELLHVVRIACRGSVDDSTTTAILSSLLPVGTKSSASGRSLESPASDLPRCPQPQSIRRLVLVVVETEALADGICRAQTRSGIPRHNRRLVVRGASVSLKLTLQKRQVDGLQISGRLRHERDPRSLGRVRNLRIFQFDLLPVCAQSRPIEAIEACETPGIRAGAQKLIVETLARIGVLYGFRAVAASQWSIGPGTSGLIDRCSAAPDKDARRSADQLKAN